MGGGAPSTSLGRLLLLIPNPILGMQETQIVSEFLKLNPNI
jgi:hypothetical protein